MPTSRVGTCPCNLQVERAAAASQPAEAATKRDHCQPCTQRRINYAFVSESNDMAKPPSLTDEEFYPPGNPRFGGADCVRPNLCLNAIVYEVSSRACRVAFTSWGASFLLLCHGPRAEQFRSMHVSSSCRTLGAAWEAWCLSTRAPLTSRRAARQLPQTLTSSTPLSTTGKQARNT